MVSVIVLTSFRRVDFHHGGVGTFTDDVQRLNFDLVQQIKVLFPDQGDVLGF